MMDDKRLRCILIGLKKYELTFREKQFIEAVEKYFNEKGVLTGQQESILEGIYMEKIWIRKTFLGQDNLPKGSSSKAV
jgi:hypothetical protein